MKTQTRQSPVIAGLAAAVLALCSSVWSPATAGAPAWVLNVQEIALYTPLEIKLGYYDSAPGTRIGAAVLWNDGTDNIIDIYDISAGASGVTVDNTFSSVVSGQVFALGEICVMDDWFIVSYSDNFDLRAIRWNQTTVENIEVDTGATNHTMTDCIGLDGSLAGIASLDFDDGEIDYYTTSDQGASWNFDFSYKPSGDRISGPFSDAFRPKTGLAPLPLGGYGIGLTYQLESGPLEAVLLDPSDGSVLGAPVDFDQFASHDSFIGNGDLKETTGLALGSFGWAFGAANGGSAIGFSWLDLETGSPGFQLLNSVTTNNLDFQGLHLTYTLEPDLLFVHTFSSRHARLTYDLNAGTRTFEEIIEYPFADFGGPVGAVAGNDRLYIAAAGFPSGVRGGEPRFMIATMDPDSTVMQGQPLGTPGGPGGPGGDSVSIPALQHGGLILLALLMAGLVWLRARA